jgi:hypothetical protein
VQSASVSHWSRRGFLASCAGAAAAATLDNSRLRQYVDGFNADDNETIVNYISNAAAFEFLNNNIPLFECPDPDIERTYYFRWWTYRKAIKETPDGFVILEFQPPVPWAGKYNTISCAAGHHFYEGRWLRSPKFLDDYAIFWFRKGGEPRRYSFWAADSIWARYLVTGDKNRTLDLLYDLVGNYTAWEKSHQDTNGLFWQSDDRDGMEISIGGSGYRATINSYMYGDAMAIVRIAEMGVKFDLARLYRRKAEAIRALVEEKLWDPAAEFFKVLPRGGNARLADVRELHGYTPWYFNLPGERCSPAWKQIMDPQGFFAPYGPTTAERRHPRFRFKNEHECLWNGPSWPYSTAVTLTAMANLLGNYKQNVVSKKDYLDLVRIYARSHRLQRPDGKVVSWIDENLDPDTGEWIARSILYARNRPDKDRGKDYNHSTFCDIVITGLAGLRPRDDDTVEVNPLVPDGAWDYFALDNVSYRGRTLTILYDRTGKQYHQGSGLRVFADGKRIASAGSLRRVTGKLP